MVKVTFKFDKERDLYANWRAAKIKNGEIDSFYRKGFCDRMNNDVFEICRDKSWKDSRLELENYLKPKYYDNFIFKIASKNFERSWRAVEKEYFRRMDNIMKFKFKDKISAFLHTGILSECKYSKNLFYISIRMNFFNRLVASGHELMHFYFKKFYRTSIKKIIGGKKTWFLSESLTVLLNEEFRDLFIFKDTGYPGHEEFREFIAESWREDKDFEVLMSKCIGYLLAKK